MLSYLEKLARARIFLNFNPFKTELSIVSIYIQNGVKNAKHTRTAYIMLSKSVLIFVIHYTDNSNGRYTKRKIRLVRE